MKYRPILFSTPMVQAILEGRKTMTRRVLKLKHIDTLQVASIHKDGSGTGWIAWSPRAVDAEETAKLYPGDQGFKCPYGKVGDILWVRETWAPTGVTTIFKADGHKYWLDQDYRETTELIKWKPSIFMPKESCRLFLKITNVRVERLQEITSDDARGEGVEANPDGKRGEYCGYKNYDRSGENKATIGFGSPKISYKSLWQKINGAASWDANPWVWVISFERVDKSEPLMDSSL